MKNLITIPFTEPFIDRLADHIFKEYAHLGNDLRRLAVVFGGRRPSLFLKRALAKRFQGPFYPPIMYTIDEWMGKMAYPSKRPTLGDLDHCYVLYSLVKEHAPDLTQGRDGFVAFLPWAREIIHFIEQLDLEDTPPNALKVLKEHAAIGFNVPDDINRLLGSLMVLRQKYHAYLEKEQITSRGYQYLRAARCAGERALEQFDQVLFSNFFYLHRTEMAVIKNLFERGKANLIMQGDQRRWPALKRIATQVDQPIVEGAEVKPTTFKLNLYAAFDMHAQAGIASEILKGIGDTSNTVLVLPHAESLLPLLSAVGPVLKEFNISLGYPLKRSSLCALLDAIVEAHKTMRGELYYARDYLRVLRNPLIKNIHFHSPVGCVRVLVHKLEDVLTGTILTPLSGQIFLGLNDILKDDQLFSETTASLASMGIDMSEQKLKDIMSMMHASFFTDWKAIATFTGLAAVMERFCRLMEEHSTMAQYPFNERVVRQLMEIAQEWSGARFGEHAFDRGDLLAIMQERLARELVAFSGTPLRGLQVLGLQETRSLSFDHVIVLDVNEGVLPKLNIYEPLIPREVMIKMNIDRLELEEEIQRYQFMRLISSAQNVHLIFQERPDKERSRFVEDLIWEQEQKAGEAGVVPIRRPRFAAALRKEPRAIAKTPAVMAFLKGFNFSATSVNTYLRNPYEFYLNYVLGLREKEDLLDDPEGRHLGIFIHGLLEDAFKPCLGKKPEIDRRFRDRLMDRFEQQFHQFFGKGMNNDAFLTKSVLAHRLGRFLDLEAERCARDVEELLFIERKYTDVIPLSCGDVRFQYRVDRVERLSDGTILIIDYKTGGADAMPSGFRIDGELSRAMLREQLGSFQMPLYLYTLEKHYPGRMVNAALYHLRTMTIEKFITSRTSVPRPELMKGFMQALDFTMAEIFNANIPFTDDAVDIE